MPRPAPQTPQRGQSRSSSSDPPGSPPAQRGRLMAAKTGVPKTPTALRKPPPPTAPVKRPPPTQPTGYTAAQHQLNAARDALAAAQAVVLQAQQAEREEAAALAASSQRPFLSQQPGDPVASGAATDKGVVLPPRHYPAGEPVASGARERGRSKSNKIRKTKTATPRGQNQSGRAPTRYRTPSPSALDGFHPNASLPPRFTAAQIIPSQSQSPPAPSEEEPEEESPAAPASPTSPADRSTSPAPTHTPTSPHQHVQHNVQNVHLVSGPAYRDVRENPNYQRQQRQPLPPAPPPPVYRDRSPTAHAQSPHPARGPVARPRAAPPTPPAAHDAVGGNQGNPWPHPAPGVDNRRWDTGDFDLTTAAAALAEEVEFTERYLPAGNGGTPATRVRNIGRIYSMLANPDWTPTARYSNYPLVKCGAYILVDSIPNVSGMGSRLVWDTLRRDSHLNRDFQMFRVVIDPSDAERVWVALTGRTYFGFGNAGITWHRCWD